MNNTETGLGVNYAPNSKRLLIFLEPGGACFNDLTCNRVAHPDGFDADDLNYVTSFTSLIPNGIADRNSDNNPFRDWNWVLFPYCSGDVYGGNANPSERTGRVHLGYQNVTKFLAWAAREFSDLEQVVFAGSSAGGFGVVYNFDQAQTAFGQDVPLVMLDDSGPPFSSDLIKPCLSQQWIESWNITDNVPEDCEVCQGSEANFMTFYPYLWEKYPNRRFALLSTEADATTRFFFGFGYEHADCEQEDEMPEDVHKAGLVELRNLADAHGASHFTTFFPTGEQHTLLLRPLDQVVADGVTLGDWLSDLVNAESPPPHAGSL